MQVLWEGCWWFQHCSVSVLAPLAEQGLLQDVADGIYLPRHGDGMQPVPQGAPSLSAS